MVRGLGNDGMLTEIMKKDFIEFGKIILQISQHIRTNYLNVDSGCQKVFFFRICTSVLDCDDNFIQKSDAAGKLGIHPTLKVIAASRILAYGISGNFVNDSLCISESTALECMKRFCTSVVRIFAEEYLRSPNEDDIERLLTENGQKGIPGMLGSTDCMHWYWDMCPVAYQGQYSGKSKKPSLVLEAIAWYDLWVWHAYFGTPGSQNDLNILDASTVIRNMGYPSKQKFKYTLNGNSYKQLYYLADGIYSSWTCFMKNYTRTH